MLRQLRPGDELHEANALDTRQLPIQLEVPDESPPFPAIDRGRGIKQRRRRVKDLGASLESGGDGEFDFFAQKIELLPGGAFRIHLGIKCHHSTDAQPRQQYPQGGDQIASGTGVGEWGAIRLHVMRLFYPSDLPGGLSFV